ncbi:MAG: cobyrinate a,c-diamide synthase [Gammaproteobacteria bacterium]|nr:cobyrinate a,c-diamide synthase [Gammaproteobacteria bacterium]
MSCLFISAAHKSSGKTTLSIGIARALRERGISLQTFKKGPDYIDPLWLSSATGRACYNLDFHTQSHAEIRAMYARHMAGSEIGMIEGNLGLYDGMDVGGSNSNAALAAMLGVPVVLVINTRGMTRGIAPLLLGYQAFDSNIRIAGVILNQVGGGGHLSKLQKVIEHYTDLKILGALRRDPALNIDERHLGLIPSNEEEHAEGLIQRLADTVRQCVDLDKLLSIAETSEPAAGYKTQASPQKRYAGLRIGLPNDKAFGFYYPDDLDRFHELGADLMRFDTLQDRQMPSVDGLFLGGGFPETVMQALEQNVTMRRAIADFIEADGPVYAECGGLIYLARSLTWGAKRCKMAGVIPADVVMHDKPQGRGYVRLQETSGFPWPTGTQASTGLFNAHEFHHTSLQGLDTSSATFGYAVKRGTGIDGSHDGYVYKNLLASYAHRRGTGKSPWVDRFLAHVELCKKMNDDE